jgi:GTPase SAR1 family protein
VIIGFIGDMGSGKTLSMVRLAYSLYLKGYTVYSNFHLKFPFEYFTLRDILEYAENSHNFTNTVFLIDEAHIFMDSRRASSKSNLAMSYFTLQTRKQNVWLFFTTQYYHQVEKRLRASTNAFVECSFKSFTDNYGLQQNVSLNMWNVIKSNKITVKKFVFNATPFFNLYDTNEVVRPI